MNRKNAVRKLSAVDNKLLEKLPAQVGEFVEAAEKTIATNYKQGNKFLKSHPLESTLVGLGLGFLLGIIVTRQTGN